MQEEAANAKPESQIPKRRRKKGKTRRQSRPITAATRKKRKKVNRNSRSPGRQPAKRGGSSDYQQFDKRFIVKAPDSGYIRKEESKREYPLPQQKHVFVEDSPATKEQESTNSYNYNQPRMHYSDDNLARYSSSEDSSFQIEPPPAKHPELNVPSSYKPPTQAQPQPSSPPKPQQPSAQKTPSPPPIAKNSEQKHFSIPKSSSSSSSSSSDYKAKKPSLGQPPNFPESFSSSKSSSSKKYDQVFKEPQLPQKFEKSSSEDSYEDSDYDYGHPDFNKPQVINNPPRSYSDEEPYQDDFSDEEPPPPVSKPPPPKKKIEIDDSDEEFKKFMQKDSESEYESDEPYFEEEITHPLRVVTKAYNVKLPVGSAAKKKITYENKDNRSRQFKIVSSHPELMAIKDSTLVINEKKKGKIQLKFPPQPKPMESLYYLYIDRDGEEWECIQITATYE